MPAIDDMKNLVPAVVAAIQAAKTSAVNSAQSFADMQAQLTAANAELAAQEHEMEALVAQLKAATGA